MRASSSCTQNERRTHAAHTPEPLEKRKSPLVLELARVVCLIWHTREYERVISMPRFILRKQRTFQNLSTTEPKRFLVLLVHNKNPAPKRIQQSGADYVFNHHFYLLIILLLFLLLPLPRAKFLK